MLLPIFLDKRNSAQLYQAAETLKEVSTFLEDEVSEFYLKLSEIYRKRARIRKKGEKRTRKRAKVA